ncbi:ubiquinone biosynthesis protein UbiE [Nocardioides sp. Soil777]|uniref:methyltransferase domain-containing protein n=1 Tax=Nocardioides sp. Soil777 TaxID=1736409 RepID=UPI000702E23A|nr:methyltransferase domain-containing protein [Nocardioides sp. Soil777]KRE99232.1 ubiquinone biosynthesis protein UbiE [Nocardioides sp. Soil777]
MAITWEAERPSDYLTRLASSDFGSAYKSLVLAELGLQPGATVVDLGCGPAADLAPLARAVGSAGRVVGIDHDASAVAIAAQATLAHPQVEVEVGDVHRLTLATGSVDRVHTDRVLQHVDDPDAVIAEAARIMRPGGVAAFAEPDWGTLVIDSPDPSIPEAYRRFICDQVIRNARIGRQVPALCEHNGLTVSRVLPVTGVFRDVATADRVFGFQRVTHRAVEAGYLTAGDGAAWLSHLRSASLFVSLTLFATFAERS